MTTIDDVSTNDMNFKHLDTAKDIVITPMNENGGHVPLNTAHTWTAKVSDGNNYIGDYPVTIEPNGIVVNSSDFTNLPAGYYHLEIWEEWTDSNGSKQRSIYPSPQRTIDFTIYQNVTDLAEKEIKTIGFQDVVDQAVMNIGMNYVFKVNTIEPDQTATVVQSAADGKNYVTFNIPKGDKGDKGDPGVPGDPGVRGLPGNDGLTPQIDAKTGHWMLGSLDTGVTAKGDKGDTGSVDNVGLTNAPAFQALQTQVNNSAVGTNLIVQSDLKPGCIDINNGGMSASPNDFYSDNYIATNGQTVFTFSSPDYVFKGAFNHTLAMYDSNEKYLGYQSINSATQTLSKSNVAYIRLSLNFVDEGGTSGNMSNWLESHRYKLEKGSVATDWCPNPSEILTQSDYAKIKAAIVALGGSLS